MPLVCLQPCQVVRGRAGWEELRHRHGETNKTGVVFDDHCCAFLRCILPQVWDFWVQRLFGSTAQLQTRTKFLALPQHPVFGSRLPLVLRVEVTLSLRRDT